MNIFILDNDIEKCAHAHTDKHMKQILEAAQLLCTAIRIHGGTKTILTDPLGKKKVVYLLPNETHKFIKQDKKGKVSYKLWLSSGLYIQTHVNHPCAAWVRESIDNFNYLCKLTIELNKEYMHRFNKLQPHKSAQMLCNESISNKAYKYYPFELQGVGFTPFAICMPEEYKVAGDAVQSYRNYYNGAKRDLHKWTNREKPEWIIE